MKKERLKKLRMICVMFLLGLVTYVLAANPSIINISNNQLFNALEDQEFTFYVVANDSDNDIPFNFTSTAFDDTVNFTVFNMENYNDTAALINFTPTNDDVALYEFYIIVEDSNQEASLVRVMFNVTNVNDQPNITSYYPTDLTPSVAENTSTPLMFNYTAEDIDIIHGDVLGSNWLLDNNIVSQNTSSYNYTPQFCDSGTHNISLVVYDTGNLNDTVNWTVTVTNTNRAPLFNTSNLINNVSWQEDNNITNNITSSSHFYDLDNLQCNGSNKDSLTYGYSGNTNITITINQTTTNVSFYPDLNWAGNETIIFNVSDGTDQNTSNQVILSVNNTNDAPVLVMTNETEWAVNYEYTQEVNATDSDTAYGDSLTFSFNVIGGTFPEFNMSSFGLINFTPTIIGVHSINITVNDSAGAADSEILTFNATTNYAPSINPIANTSTFEAELFNITITATDANNDNLTFNTNYSRLGKGVVNSTASYFYFTPNNNDVGNHTISINVTDKYGASDNTTFRLIVYDINSAPVLSAIGSQVAKINKTFTLYVNATDSDNDVLNFADNATFFNITTTNSTSAQALINFTPTDDDKGNYSVLITVSDWNLNDSEVVNFTITSNRAPTINTIPNQTAQTGVLFSLNITGGDLDGDTLNFSTNYSRFDVSSINSSAARLSFISIITDMGVHIVNVTADDNDGLNISTTFYLNITYGNNTPFFENISNKRCILDRDCRFNIIGYDLDGETLNFSALPDLFTITNTNTTINSTTARFNFTPTNSSARNYTINVTVDDGNKSNSTTFIIFINNAPTIDSYIPTDLTPMISENSTLLFNHTSSDSDNDSINYTWRLGNIDDTTEGLCSGLDSTNQSACENNNLGVSCSWNNPLCIAQTKYLWWRTKSNNRSWLYETNYTAAGNYTVALIVMDVYGADTNMTWNLTVNNTNRIPDFGKKTHTTRNDFSTGTFNQTNLTSGGIIRLETNNSFYSGGTFTSASIDFGTSYTEMNLTTIEWNSTKPSSTNIMIETRTSADESSWSSWVSYNQSGNEITSPNNQYLQYKIILSTTNTSISPNISIMVINYIIANKTWNENTVLLNWIDLDDFFSDSDSDDTFTFNVSGNSNIIIEIDSSTHRVNLRPLNDFVGSETVFFSLSDGYAGVLSNNMTLTTVDVESEQEATVGGGGGAATTITEIEEKEVNITQLISFDLIRPGESTTYANGSVKTPILIQNLGNETLKGITLSVESENQDLNLSLSINYIEELAIDETVETILYITPDRAYNSYEIVIKADIEEPAFKDSAKIFISSLIRGEHNATQINTKITFMEDLLRENPECLELNEALKEAKTKLQNKEYEKAGELIDSVIESCKYLISMKGKEIEKLSERDIFMKLKRFMKTREFYISAIFFAIVGILTTIYFVYEGIKQKK